MLLEKSNEIDPYTENENAADMSESEQGTTIACKTSDTRMRA